MHSIVNLSSFFYSFKMLFGALANLSIAFLRCSTPALSPLFTKNLEIRVSTFSHFFHPVVFGATSLSARGIKHSRSLAPFLLADLTEFRSMTFTQDKPFEPTYDPAENASFLIDNCVFQQITPTAIDLNGTGLSLELRCSFFDECGAAANLEVASAYIERCFSTNTALTGSVFSVVASQWFQMFYCSTASNGGTGQGVHVQKSGFLWRHSNVTSMNVAILTREWPNVMVDMVTFSGNKGDPAAIDGEVYAPPRFTKCNFLNTQGYMFACRCEVRECFFSATKKILKTDETPMGWVVPLEAQFCVFVEPWSELEGVESTNSQFGVGASGTTINVEMFDNYKCNPKPTSYIPPPTQSPRPDMPTASPSQSPHPTNTPKATTNVPLILKATIPTVVLLIVLPILLFYCIRMIQDSLSEDQFQLGVRLEFNSEGGSSETANRENAMWLGDDDEFDNEERSDFFHEDPRHNVEQTFADDHARPYDSSSSF